MNKKSLAAAMVIFGILFQATAVFAADAASPADFFENAWQEAAASQAYSFVCTVSSSNSKVAPNSLTGDKKKLVDLTLAALKRYKEVTQYALLGEKHQLATSQMKLNTLGILDQMGVGKFNLDEAVRKMKQAAKKKADILVVENDVYYKGANEWKMFQDIDTAAVLINAVAAQPFTAFLEKTSFKKSKATVYNGTLTASATESLLTPFIGANEAKKSAPAPVKLFVTGDGHFKKFNVVNKVVIGGLSFTVKEQCDLKLKNVKIKIPSGAASVDTDAGKKEFIELVQSI